MKKKFSLIAIIMLTSLALTGCGEKKNEILVDTTHNDVVNNTTPTDVINNTTSAVDYSSAIIGSWKNNELGVDFIYTFNGDGTGNYDAAGTDMPFSYKVDGKSLSILFDGDDVSMDTEFDIIGNILNVKDSMGEDTLYNKIDFSSVPKSEQIGTAGSNIPLKDNHDEAEYQIKVAMQNKFIEMYGEKVFDARFNVEKIYTYEDEQENPILKEMNLGANDVAFEINYDIKPAEGVDPIEFTIPNGEYDEENGWVKNCSRLGILQLDDAGNYTITNYGTGW